MLQPNSFMANALQWIPQLAAGDVVRAPFGSRPPSRRRPRGRRRGRGARAHRARSRRPVVPPQRPGVAAARAAASRSSAASWSATCAGRRWSDEQARSELESADADALRRRVLLRSSSTASSTRPRSSPPSPSCSAARRAASSGLGAGPRRRVRERLGARGVEHDLDVVAHLQRAHEAAVGLDAPAGLHDRHRRVDALAVAPQVELDRLRPARDREVALDGPPSTLLEAKRISSRPRMSFSIVLRSTRGPCR